MTLDTRDRRARFPSIGVDAVSLDRYSDIRTDDELIIYDEQCEDGWIQCDFWIPVESME